MVSAIEKGDARRFVRLVSAGGLTSYHGKTKVVVRRAALDEAIQAAGGLAAFLEMDGSGGWFIQAYRRPDLWLRRDDGDGDITVVSLTRSNGKWSVVGTYHGADGGTEPD